MLQSLCLKIHLLDQLYREFRTNQAFLDMIRYKSSNRETFLCLFALALAHDSSLLEAELFSSFIFPPPLVFLVSFLEFSTILQ